MATTEKEIKVVENNDPLVTVTVRVKDEDGNRRAYDLTGATIQLYVKSAREDTDAAALFTYTSSTEIVVTDATGGVLTIQFAASDIDSAGTYYYHLDAIKNLKRQTVMFGPLKVVNV